MRPTLLATLCVCVCVLHLVQVHGRGDYDYDDHYSDAFGGVGKGGDCNDFQRIGYKESYTIRSFPPPPFPYQHHQQYNTGRMRLAPEECSLKFFTTDEDCVLEFRSHYFEKGDEDCESQALLFRDERRSKRICGHAEPGRRFVSTGSTLSLVSFRRNGYQRTVPSTVSGVVRCVGVGLHQQNYAYAGTGMEHYYNDYSKIEYNKTCETPPPSDTACQPSAPNCTTLATLFANETNGEFFYAISYIGPTANSFVGQSNNFFCDDTVNGCSGVTNICFQTINLGCNVTANAINPITPGAGGIQCMSKAASCRFSGTCNVSGLYGPLHSPALSIAKIECPATAAQLCVWTISQCTKPR